MLNLPQCTSPPLAEDVGFAQLPPDCHRTVAGVFAAAFQFDAETQSTRQRPSGDDPAYVWPEFSD